MRTLFFCARDIRDYLKGIIDTSALENTTGFEPNFPALTDASAVQKFLYDLMKVYDNHDQKLTSTIVGETGVDGVRLDFNFGLRLELPAGNFHVTISDADTEQIFFDREISDVRLISVEKYFIRWRVEIFRDDRKIFEHVLDLEGQPVLVSFYKKSGLGDQIAMMPSVREFKYRHCCELSICLREYMRDFAANLYPDLPQVDAVTAENYASYFLTMYGGSFPFCPVDFRNEPMEKMASVIFGLDTLPTKPTFTPTAPPVTNETYVCIGVQASTPTKGWHYPGGWEIVVDYLKSLGYRVFCIDKEKFQRDGNYTAAMPANAEDFTGDFSITERANMLYHAEFFIGLGSGLAWLANAVNCPVILICGFSQDWFEFYTPYRVANRLVCNGCLNDMRVNFLCEVCPYHKGTARELECQKKISPRQVLNAIERLIIDRNLTPPLATRI